MDGESDNSGYPIPDPAEFDPDEIDASVASLSERQRAMLAWIADGATNSGLSTRFELGRHTIEQEVSRILETLGVETRHAAAAAHLHWEQWQHRSTEKGPSPIY